MALDRQINPEMIMLAREARRVTQRELAERLGIAQGTLSRIENRLAIAPDSRLPGLASTLQFQPEFFLRTDPVYGPSASEF